MHPTDLTFYEDKTCKHCELSLTGEKCNYGNFEKIEDTLLVKFNNESFKPRTRKYVRDDKILYQIDKFGQVEYEYYLDSKFRIENHKNEIEIKNSQ